MLRVVRSSPALPVDGVHARTMDVGAIDLPGGAAYYLCGPLPFMQAVRSALIDRGVAPRDIQSEVLGPDPAVPVRPDLRSG